MYKALIRLFRMYRYKKQAKKAYFHKSAMNINYIGLL
jgi:hypothetical protein